MIHLTKIESPQVLEDNWEVWTDELLAEIGAGGDQIALRASKYRTPGIKDRLKEETHKKCAYCESKPLHVAHGDIEHVTPKAVAPELTFQWANLTLACDVCNTNKGSKLGLIDPYDVDPEDEFDFHGPMMLHRFGHAAAELTRIELDLNRSDLLERRCARLQSLRDLLEKFDMRDDPEERNLLRNAAIEYETRSEREYAACVRAFLR